MAHSWVSTIFRRTVLGAAFLAASVSMALATAPRAPIEAFANLPYLTDIQLSPDGSKYALIRRYENRNIAVIVDRRRMEVLSGFTVADGVIRRIDWVGPDRALLSIDFERYVATYGQRLRLFNLVSVTADGKEQDVLMRRFSGEAEERMRGQVPQAIRLLSPNVFDGNKVLVSAWTGSQKDVFEVSIDSGTARLALKGRFRYDVSGRLEIFTFAWMAGHDGESWVRWDQDNRTNPPTQEVYAKLGDGDWNKIDSYPIGGNANFRVEGFSDKPGTLIVTAPRPMATSALYEYDVRTQTLGDMIFAHPYNNIAGARLSTRTGELISAYLIGDAPSEHVLLPSWARMQAIIDDYFNTTPDNRMISKSDDGAGIVIKTSGPSAPDAFYYLNARRMEVELIGSSYPELARVQMGPVRALTYKARDGLAIRAYLTLPYGVEAKNLPTVILPHGGPHSRDYMVFDWMTQLLANRGYAVLQPNFRGSTDRGQRFMLAGFGEWGGKMQDDVTDGAKYLIDQGIADPDRICIMGASYGGYAALMGAVKTPDLYNCAASINGVSDLVMLMRGERDSIGLEFWEASIGTDLEKQRANSPALHADKVKSPILLIHGQDDRVVRIRQSRKMYEALRRAGKAVKFVELEGDDHFLSKGDTRIKTMREVETFFADHLGE